MFAHILFEDLKLNEVNFRSSYNNFNDLGVQGCGLAWDSDNRTASVEPMTPAVSPPSDSGTPPQGPFGELSAIFKAASEYSEYLSSSRTPHNQGDVNWLRSQFQTAEFILESLQDLEAEPDSKKRFKCFICEGKEYGTHGTLKRHITSEHYPESDYFCALCRKEGRIWSTNRRDKHHEHMRVRHQQRALTKTEMRKVTIPQTPPAFCVFEECGRPIKNWDEFFECVYQHFSISDGIQKQPKDRKGGDGGGDPGKRFGSRQLAPPGNNSHDSQAHRADEIGGICKFEPRWLDTESVSSSPDGSIPPAVYAGQCNDRLHYGSINSEKKRSVEATNANVSAEIEGADRVPTKHLFSRKLGGIVPGTGHDKAQKRNPMAKPEETKQRVYKVCGHTLENCGQCERLAGALIPCHHCADDQSVSIGGVKTSSLENLNGEAPGLGDSVNSKRLSSVAWELAAFNPMDKANSSYRFIEIMRKLLSFRFEYSIRKHHGGSSKSRAGGETASEEIVATDRD
ncbi:hypothetical protein BJX70DRAFT_402927 [Aspergillus crustosus]